MGVEAINNLIERLIKIIVGCTGLICGTIILLIFWPIGIFIQIIGICILLDIINIYKFKRK